MHSKKTWNKRIYLLEMCIYSVTMKSYKHTKWTLRFARKHKRSLKKKAKYYHLCCRQAMIHLLHCWCSLLEIMNVFVAVHFHKNLLWLYHVGQQLLQRCENFDKVLFCLIYIKFKIWILQVLFSMSCYSCKFMQKLNLHEKFLINSYFRWIKLWQFLYTFIPVDRHTIIHVLFCKLLKVVTELVYCMKCKACAFRLILMMMKRMCNLQKKEANNFKHFSHFWFIIFDFFQIV